MDLILCLSFLHALNHILILLLLIISACFQYNLLAIAIDPTKLLCPLAMNFKAAINLSVFVVTMNMGKVKIIVSITRKPYHFRAIIATGINAGRYTNIGADDDASFDNLFKRTCCSSGSTRCFRYTDKRPITPLDDDPTKCKCTLLN